MKLSKYKFEEELYKSLLESMYARHQESLKQEVLARKDNGPMFRVVDERVDELPYE